MQNVAKLGVSGSLFLVFLVLRLIGAIDWSWLWITSPLWVSVLIVAAIGFSLWILTRGKGQPITGR